MALQDPTPNLETRCKFQLVKRIQTAAATKWHGRLAHEPEDSVSKGNQTVIRTDSTRIRAYTGETPVPP
jgi:hypothetical protein